MTSPPALVLPIISPANQTVRNVGHRDKTECHTGKALPLRMTRLPQRDAARPEWCQHSGGTFVQRTLTDAVLRGLGKLRSSERDASLYQPLTACRPQGSRAALDRRAERFRAMYESRKAYVETFGLDVVTGHAAYVRDSNKPR